MNLVIMPVVVSRELTRRAIDSVLAQDIGDVHMHVVMNGAQMGLYNYLRAHYHAQPNVGLLAHAKMRSLNKVWNDNLYFAFVTLGLPYALVVNNDLELRTDTYRVFVNDGTPFVTGVAVDKREMLAHADPSAKQPHPCFSCFLIRRECWQRVGPFDESFWAYASDNDYHLRMDALGVDAVQLSVPFYHEASSTLKLVDSRTRDALLKHADDDMAYFKRKWGCESGSPEYEKRFREWRDGQYVKRIVGEEAFT